MFLEETVLEKGFAKLFASKIQPAIMAYQKAFRLRIYCGLGGTLTVLTAGYVFFQLAQIEIIARPHLFLIYVFLAFIFVLVWFPLSKLIRSWAAFLKSVTSEHFGDILLPAESQEPADELLGKLRKFQLVEFGPFKTSNHFTGIYRGCHLQMMNILISDRKCYFILDVSVPKPFDDTVVIRPNNGRLLNLFHSKFPKHKRVGINNSLFEEHFKVYARDANQALQLITPAFCKNLLAIPKLFPSSLENRGIFRNYLSGIFNDGSFSLILPNNRNFFQVASVNPKNAEKACRQLIARMGIIKDVVDHLHGDY